MVVFAHDYLVPITAALTDEHKLLTSADISAFLTPFILVSAVFILAMLIMYATLYRRLLNSLDTEIKQLRSWLMLFPPEIIRAVPTISTAIEEIVKNARRHR